MVEKRCRLCHGSLRHTFVDMGVLPLANSYLRVEQLGYPEPMYPLRAFVCGDCFLVQSDETASLEELFSEYPYLSSCSESWLQHAREYVEMVVGRFGMDGRSHIVEVGSNDGYLLQYFKEKGMPVLGIEPAANVAAVALRRGIPTLVKFFGQQTARGVAGEWGCADLLVGNNVLAHVHDLHDFVHGIKILLKPRGIITLEFPHLMKMVDGRQFDTIYHEHVSYFSLFTVERLFAAHALAVFDVEVLPTHGGSLRIYVRHSGDSSRPVGARVGDLRARERTAGLDRLEYYQSFAPKVTEAKSKLQDFVYAAKREGKSIVGYGAPAKGATLLSYCGIGPEFVKYTVDVNPYKQNRFLPGTHIPIRHPDEIRQTRPHYLLILAWNLRQEIMKQMAHICEWGGQFVIPVPEIKVYSLS